MMCPLLKEKTKFSAYKGHCGLHPSKPNTPKAKGTTRLPEKENDHHSKYYPTIFTTIMPNQPATPDEAPKTAQDWCNEVKPRELEDTTIHSTALSSASKFGFEQFLLLRVLWK